MIHQLRPVATPAKALLVLVCCVLSAAAGTDPPITATAFARDGRSLVAVSQTGLHVFGWPELDHQRTIKAAAANLHAAAFSVDGKLLAIAGGDPAEQGTVQVFSWPDGNVVATMDQHADSILSVRWIGNEQLLTASIDRDVKRWSLKEPKVPLQTYKGHSRGVAALQVLDDGVFVSAGDDQSIRVWDLQTGKVIRSLNQHTKPIRTTALRPNKGGLPMLASAGSDRTIRFWQPTIGRMVRYVRLERAPLQIAWLDEARVVAACVDGHVRVIDADEVKVVQDLPVIKGWAYAVSVHSTDGSLVVAGTDGQIRRVIPAGGDK